MARISRTLTYRVSLGPQAPEGRQPLAAAHADGRPGARGLRGRRTAGWRARPGEVAQSVAGARIWAGRISLFYIDLSLLAIHQRSGGRRDRGGSVR